MMNDREAEIDGDEGGPLWSIVRLLVRNQYIGESSLQCRVVCWFGVVAC